MLPLLGARRGVLDAHLGDCHLRHVDQSVDSKLPSDRRHGHGRFQVTGGYGHAEVDPPMPLPTGSRDYRSRGCLGALSSLSVEARAST